jgi:hypothetical protein
MGMFSPEAVETTSPRHARSRSTYSPGEARRSLIAYLDSDSQSSYTVGTSRPASVRDFSGGGGVPGDKAYSKARQTTHNAESGTGFLASVLALGRYFTAVTVVGSTREVINDVVTLAAGFARERRSYAASVASSANMDEFLDDDDDDDDDQDLRRESVITDKGKRRDDDEQQQEQGGTGLAASRSAPAEERSPVIDLPVAAPAAALAVEEVTRNGEEKYVGEIVVLAEQAGEAEDVEVEDDLVAVERIKSAEAVPQLETMPLVDIRPHMERHLSKSFSKLRASPRQAPRKTPSLGELSSAEKEARQADIQEMIRQASKPAPMSFTEAKEASTIVVDAPTNVDDIPPETPPKSPHRRRPSATSNHGYQLDEVVKSDENLQSPLALSSEAPIADVEEKDQPPVEEVQKILETKEKLAAEDSPSITEPVAVDAEPVAEEPVAPKTVALEPVAIDLAADVQPKTEETAPTISDTASSKIASDDVTSRPIETISEASEAPPPKPLERRLTSAFRRDTILRSISVFKKDKEKKAKESVNDFASIVVAAASAASELTPPPTPRALSVAEGQDQSSITERPKSRMSMFAFGRKEKPSKENAASIADTTDSGLADLSATLASSSAAQSHLPDTAQEVQGQSSLISVSSSAQIPPPMSSTPRTDAAAEENSAAKDDEPKTPVRRRSTFRAFSTSAASTKSRTQSWFSTRKLKTNEKGEFIDPGNDDNTDAGSVAPSATEAPSTPTKTPSIKEKPKLFRTPTLGLKRPTTSSSGISKTSEVTGIMATDRTETPKTPSKAATRMKGLVRATFIGSRKKDKGKAKADI